MQVESVWGPDQDNAHSITVIDCAATGARVTSPRSLEACRRMGFKPSELLPKAVVEFLDHGVNRKYSLVEKEAAVLRHEHYEQLRQQKLETVRTEREAIIQGLGPAPPSTALLVTSGNSGSPLAGNTSPVTHQQVAPGFPPRRIQRAAEEAKRQEEQQRKIRARRMQLVANKHEKEIAKKKEEDHEALERKNRQRVEAERERELAEEARQKARQRALEAAQRDLERQQNADAFRAQTRELLRQQEEVVAENRRRMLEKERQVAMKMESASKCRHQEALERREKATVRIENVTYQNELALARKKQEVTDKQAAAAERAREIQRKTVNELKERAAKSKQEEHIRQKRLESAYAQQQKHVSELLAKREDLEAKMETSQQEREKSRLLVQVEHQLGVAQKEENVARIQRMEAYARQQLMRKITSADDRSRAIKERKQALLQARQQASTEAMIRRHRLTEAVDKMRTSSNTWDKIEETLYSV
ncbi:hypothetical protein BBJ29_000843 [Phytophthora kernoviae]|uniref:Uncharacterized protein n=1 Tax=Phytophthora kernoviae TaxID=325452 RepID=A0A3F2S3S0_9STRA|nr:hypothetical protein BBJ29_000843 [Phytophthora kernoviae]RLN69155.1 hypothetical protein BBP00_00000559 [Phytophthora kernoviae]